MPLLQGSCSSKTNTIGCAASASAAAAKPAAAANVKASNRPGGVSHSRGVYKFPLPPKPERLTVMRGPHPKANWVIPGMLMQGKTVHTAMDLFGNFSGSYPTHRNFNERVRTDVMRYHLGILSRYIWPLMVWFAGGSFVPALRPL